MRTQLKLRTVKGEDLGEERTLLPMGHYLFSLIEGWETSSLVAGSRLQAKAWLKGLKNVIFNYSLFLSCPALWFQGASGSTAQRGTGSAACYPLWVMGFHPAPGLGYRDRPGIEQ